MKKYKLGRMRKYILCEIASLLTEHTILLIIEYADLMVESGPEGNMTRLQTMQTMQEPFE